MVIYILTLRPSDKYTLRHLHLTLRSALKRIKCISDLSVKVHKGSTNLIILPEFFFNYEFQQGYLLATQIDTTQARKQKITLKDSSWALTTSKSVQLDGN